MVIVQDDRSLITRKVPSFNKHSYSKNCFQQDFNIHPDIQELEQWKKVSSAYFKAH